MCKSSRYGDPFCRFLVSFSYLHREANPSNLLLAFVSFLIFSFNPISELASEITRAASFSKQPQILLLSC